MPLLSTCNHFEILSNIQDSKMISLEVKKSENIPIPALISDPVSIPILTPRVQNLK